MKPPEEKPAANRRILSRSELRSDDVMGIFAEEARDHLDQVGELLRQLEARPSDTSLMRGIWQRIHTIKGTAGILGLSPISRLAHSMEDLLRAVEGSGGVLDPSAVGLLFATHDALFDSLEDEAAFQAALGPLEAHYARMEVVLGEVAGGPKVPAVDPPGLPEDRPAEEISPAKSRQEETLRVPARRLDGLLNVGNELITLRGAFDLRLNDTSQLMGELRGSLRRLSRVARDLLEEVEAPQGIAAERVLAAGTEFDPLEMDTYSELYALTRELEEAVADVGWVGGGIGSAVRDLEDIESRYEQLVTDVREGLMTLRMVPFSNLVNRLHRTVRVTAKQRSKEAALELVGETVEVDKRILDRMAEPLLHLLRNAVDHGLEPPEARQREGKDPSGKIVVEVGAEGGEIVIRVWDDGQGIDLEKIRARATELGLLAAESAHLASPEVLRALIFRPRLSTMREADQISGRGIGLDVVQDAVRSLQGTVEVDTGPAGGARFTLRLPRSLSVSQAVWIENGGQQMAAPLTSIREVRQVSASDIFTDGEGARWLRLDDQELPALELGDCLDQAAAGARRGLRPALIVWAEGHATALLAERVLGVSEIVIQPTERLFGTSIPGITGATLAGDGRVLLVINPADLIRVPAGQRSTAGRRTEAAEVPPEVLVVDDSLSVRQTLSQVVEAVGWRPRLARDGRDALDQLRQAQPLPQAILMDIEMPHINGFELTTLLRSREAYRQIPIIMITSRAGQKHRDKALQLGANAYMVKPYQVDDLLETLFRLTSGETPEAPGLAGS